MNQLPDTRDWPEGWTEVLAEADTSAWIGVLNETVRVEPINLNKGCKPDETDLSANPILKDGTEPRQKFAAYLRLNLA